MSETTLLRRVLLAVAPLGARLFRNNVGRLPDARGGWVAYGLCVGSSDLIGWTPVVVTPALVGRTLPVFTALEIKSPRGRVTPEQTAFLAAVRRAGGIAAVVRTEAEAAAALGSTP